MGRKIDYNRIAVLEDVVTELNRCIQIFSSNRDPLYYQCRKNIEGIQYAIEIVESMIDDVQA